MSKISLSTPGSTAKSLDTCAGSFILDPKILGPFQTGKVWDMTLFDTSIEAAGISRLDAECAAELKIGMCGPSFAAYLELTLPSVTTDSAGPLKTISLRFNGAAGYKAGFFLGISLNVGMSIRLSTWQITLPECSVSPVHCHTEGAHCHTHGWHTHCDGPTTTCSGGDVHCSGGSARFAKVLGIDFEATIDLIAVMAKALNLTSITGNIDISSQAQFDLADATQAGAAKLKATFLCQIDMVQDIPELRAADQLLKDMGGSLAMGPEFSITLQTTITLTSFGIDGNHYAALKWGTDASGPYIAGTIDTSKSNSDSGFEFGFGYQTSLLFSAGVFATVKAFKILSIEGRFDIPVFNLSSQPGSLGISTSGKISQLGADDGRSPANAPRPPGLDLPEVVFHAPTKEFA